MAEEPGKSKPNPTDRADAAKAKRAERLAGALRNNLRRRTPPVRKISERPGVKNDGVTVETDADKDQDPNG